MAARRTLGQTRSMDTDSHLNRPASPPPAAGFFDWLRGLGITRGTDRWLAGVAGGVAARLRIDPLITRGAFVVLAVLGGPGVLLYLLGWLLLPDTEGRIHVQEIIRGRASAGMITAAVILTALVIVPAMLGLIIPGVRFPTISVWSWDIWNVLGFPSWLTATIASLFWIAIIVFGAVWLRRALLQRGREEQRGEERGDAFVADRPAPSTREPAADASSPAASTERSHDDASRDSAADWAQRTAESADDWARRAAGSANEWSRNLSEQVDAWSARYAAEHDTRRLGAGHLVITLALALLAGGAAALWAAAPGVSIPLDGAAPGALVAGLVAGVAVLAVSMIVAGVRGRHTDWIGFLAACGVVALLVTVVLPAGSRFQPFGSVHVGTDGPAGTVIIAGDADVDLTDISDRPSGSDDLELWMFAGRATIDLPSAEPTIVRIRMFAGRIDERGTAKDQGTAADVRQTAGPFLAREIRSHVDPGAASAANVVTVTLFAGTVAVRGGDPSIGPESATRDSGSHSRDDGDARARASAVSASLDTVAWKLDEPGLSARDRRALEAERTELQRTLDTLELEMQR